MKPSDVVSAFMRAVEADDFETASKYISDNFVMEGVGPTPLGKNEFLGAHRAFNTGLPDFAFNEKIIRETGNDVEVKVQLTGHHTKDMQPPIPGLGVIKATNNHVKMPEETLSATVKDDKISRVRLQQVPGGGLPGVLKQIGVDILTTSH